MTFSISEPSSREHPRFAAVARQALVRNLSQNLATAGERIDSDKPLHSYGVNFLLAIELRTWTAREFAAEVAVLRLGGRDGGGNRGDICED